MVSFPASQPPQPAHRRWSSAPAPPPSVPSLTTPSLFSAEDLLATIQAAPAVQSAQSPHHESLAPAASPAPHTRQSQKLSALYAWPCRSFTADTAEVRQLHVWQETSSAGCFRCEGCGRVGVCAACYIAEGHVVPRLAVQMQCSCHRDLREEQEQAVETSLLAQPIDAAKQQSETPIHGMYAARNWVRLLDRAETLFAKVSADLESRPERIDWWRQVSAAFTSVTAYEHQLTPTTRRLAREVVWRRAHPDEPLPLYEPPTREGPEPGAVYRRAWERCQCTTCRLAREQVKQRQRASSRKQPLSLNSLHPGIEPA